MAQSWFSDPELLATNFSVSYVSNNLSKAGDTVVRLVGLSMMRLCRHALYLSGHCVYLCACGLDRCMRTWTTWWS